jgi:hypothetical protein
MRPITWLHISDFHLREQHAGPQDAVLSSMIADIARRRKIGMSFDFILASGDLAFSGKGAEYGLAASFFDELSAASELPRERIFCIPGNHDIDRTRQTTAFAGARLKLRSQNDVYPFLSSIEERETLLKRLENFRKFQESYFVDQVRTLTPDGLGYVSSLEIADVRIAIVGLNSAWLADGGFSDHGRLLLGEPQVRETLKQAKCENPHIIVGMGHHPLQLLQDFDRRPSQRLIEEVCHFFHCGHLHEPEAHESARLDFRCLTLAAGASFESRDSHNAYSIVTLDLLHARRVVKFIRYNPADGTFSYESDRTYPIEINATKQCSLGELAKAIGGHVPTASWPHYLAALLLEMQAEVPIPSDASFFFGSLDLLMRQPNSDLKVRTLSFIAVGNLIRLFFDRLSLADILRRHGEAIGHYSEMLQHLCESNSDLRDKLTGRESDAQTLAGVEPLQPFAHTIALLDQLKAEEDWNVLRDQAERHIASPDHILSRKAKRILALCLARSTERADRERAAANYRDLVEADNAEAEDSAALATVLSAIDDYGAAKAVILSGITKFPASADGFADIGQKIVEATGDREFREQLLALNAVRRAR